MSLNLKQCEADALKLAPKDRALLAERLISSLDSLEESEIEQLWLEEAERRYKEYRNGKISARSAQDVLRAVRTDRKKVLTPDISESLPEFKKKFCNMRD